MTYAKVLNGEVIKTGTVFEMETRCSNPTLLSELELRGLNVYKVQSFDQLLQPWERKSSSSYIYNESLDIVREVIIVEDKDLEAFKAEKLAENKQTLAQIKTEGFTTTTGIKIGCEDKDKTALLDQLIRIERKGLLGSPLVDFNNEIHNLSLVDFESLVLELGDYLYKIFMNKQTLRGLTNACTTHEEVNNIWWRNVEYDETGMEVLGITINPILN